MKITRINKIKAHRAFIDFEWRDLQDFGRFNLIYGWNGSGKTTLSNLFRHVQMPIPITEGQVEFHIDGKAVQGSALILGAALPRVRVFNRDFVTSSIGTNQSALSPIFFLGADSVEKQKEIEALKKKQDAAKILTDDKDRAKKAAETGLDKFCIQGAAAIKELLKSSGQNNYNNYDKSHFKKGCLLQVKPESPSMALDEKSKAELKQKKDGTPKDRIEPFSLTIPDLAATLNKCGVLLKKTVVSQVLEELTPDADLAEWVRAGLPHHTGAKTTTECHFCGSPLPQGRLARLEAHFNDAYNKFLEEIDAAIRDIETIDESFTKLIWPGKAEFYNHLAADFVKTKASVSSEQVPIRDFLEKIKSVLISKRQRPFESLDLPKLLDGTVMPDTQTLTQAVEEVQSVIQKHNKATDDFQSEVVQAREKLEKCFVAEALEEFKELSAKIKTLDGERIAADVAKKEFEEKITILEREIVEHRRPAEQLNEELYSYLGHNDLTLAVKETGYEITRNAQIATNLSEGEKAAIAFLYFLKSLQDKNFTIATDVVVIDDPVSSLDATALFCAFGYMKARTKDAGQLFILTHNFNFFRQVRNWFNHLPKPDKKEARFYMVEAGVTNGKRNCSLRTLDKLLREYESEYHYIFKRVYEEANKPSGQRMLEDYYCIPNIARRLLEAFFAFRYPQESGELYRQLERVDASYEPAKKARILRFVHTYSHDETVGESGHDLSLLAETPQILKEIIELLKHQDAKHFDEMEKIVKSAQVPDA